MELHSLGLLVPFSIPVVSLFGLAFVVLYGLVFFFSRPVILCSQTIMVANIEQQDQRRMGRGVTKKRERLERRNGVLGLRFACCDFFSKLIGAIHWDRCRKKSILDRMDDASSIDSIFHTMSEKSFGSKSDPLFLV